MRVFPSVMTDGGDGEFKVIDCVKALVSELRNHVKLHPVTVDSASMFLAELAQGAKDAGEVRANLPEAGDDWVTMFEEAWKEAGKKAMPNYIAVRNREWAGVPIEVPKPPPPLSGFPLPMFGGGDSGGGAGHSAGPKSLPALGSDGFLTEAMHGLNVSDHDLNKAMDDIKSQRISGLRILALSLALVSGRVHPAGESADFRYGSDMRLCQLVRQQRKAGVSSLDDVLKGKNKRELATHFTRLAKEYNNRHMIEEATLVSQFWAETSSSFEGDDTGLFVYVSEWMRSYAGRGIPKLLDTDLILRHRNIKVEGGVSSNDVKELKDTIKSLKAKVEESAAESKRVQTRLQKVESGKPAADPGKKSCFICGGDHLARNCPDKDKRKPAKADVHEEEE